MAQARRSGALGFGCLSSQGLMRRNHASDVPADQALCLSARALACAICTSAWHRCRVAAAAGGQRGRGGDAAAPNLTLRMAGTGPTPPLLCVLSLGLPGCPPASPPARMATTAGTTPSQRLCAALRVPPLFLGVWLGVQPHDTPDMASPTRYFVATSLPLRRSKFADSRTSAMGGSPFSSEMIPPRLQHLTEEIMFVSGGRNYRVVAELGLQWAPCQ